VFGVERPSIRANVEPIATDFLDALVAIVARVTETLKLAEQERVPITTMRGDMVGNRSRRHAPAFEAESAQWLYSEMPVRAFLPLPKLVPVMAVCGNPTHLGASTCPIRRTERAPTPCSANRLHNAVLGSTSTVAHRTGGVRGIRHPAPAAPTRRWEADEGQN
jgi:hypothetical protein